MKFIKLFIILAIFLTNSIQGCREGDLLKSSDAAGSQLVVCLGNVGTFYKNKYCLQNCRYYYNKENKMYDCCCRKIDISAKKLKANNECSILRRRHFK